MKTTPKKMPNLKTVIIKMMTRRFLKCKQRMTINILMYQKKKMNLRKLTRSKIHKEMSLFSYVSIPPKSFGFLPDSG